MIKNISFASGSLGNVPILEKILEQSISEIDARTLLNYSDPLGLPNLRKQIAELYESKITTENVMITSSTQQALNMLVNYLVREKRKDFFVQEPAYFGMLRILRKNKKIKITPFNDLEEIEKRLRKSDLGVVYITSNFHNPTGKTLSLEKKSNLSELAKEKDLIILEDNPHDFLYFGEQKPSKIFELAPENTMYTSGFSKILGPGIRVGYLIANKKTIENIKPDKINQDIFTSTLCQQVCINALNKKEYMKELRKHFENKRNLALSCLERYFKTEDRFIWNNPEGGIFILGQFSDSINCETIIKIGKERYNLLLEKDKYSYHDGKSRNTTRINFVQNQDKFLEEGIIRLYNSFKDVQNGS